MSRNEVGDLFDILFPKVYYEQQLFQVSQHSYKLTLSVTYQGEENSQMGKRKRTTD